MLSLTQASAIVDAVLVTARELALRPVAVTVLRPRRPSHRAQTRGPSRNTATRRCPRESLGCLGMGQGGGTLASTPTARPPSSPHWPPSRRTHGFVPSGVLIRDSDGTLLGAVGVSGDRPDNDERAATAGIESVGLIADAG